MTHMEEWQLDAIDAVMRRCDAISDFSAEQIAETLEKMGFTIASRELPPTTERARRNCSKITPHAAHNFSDYALLLRCPGVAGKPKTQKRGPSPSLVIVDEVPAAFFQRCNEFATHLPHGVCPGKESTEEPATPKFPSVNSHWVNKNRPEEVAEVQSVDVLSLRLVFVTNAKQANTNDWTIETFYKHYEPLEEEDEPACTVTKPHERHVWEQGDQVYGCPGVVDVNAYPKNLSEAFKKTPIDSTWMRKTMSENQSNECRVFEVFFRKMETRNEFFVRVRDTWDDAKVWPLMPFLDEWERI